MWRLWIEAMTEAMASIRFAIKRAAAVLMQLPAPDAAKPEEPTIPAVSRHAEDARVLWSLDVRIC